ncbi:MAG: hypothetical protein PGN21_00585 [Sphingomonas paucimobilis]
MDDDIPEDILAAIRGMARADWPGDRDMQSYIIEAETKAYRALQSLDYGNALPHKDAILAEADTYHSGWDEIHTFVSEQVDAFHGLAALAPEDIPPDYLAEHKRRAAAEQDWFTSQLEEVEQAIESYRYIQRTRAKVGPIRDILVRMEAIIGSECYNANIQNYSAWGVWEGEGRSFRYPVTYLRDGKEEKRKARVDDLQPEALITGHYKFGANELSIHRALIRIIDMLQADYGLTLPADGKLD